MRETYQDWQVACVMQSNTKSCGLSQIQAQQSGQRVLAIEIGPASNGAVTGTLVLPFGLALDRGVALQIDDKPVGQPLRFRTCLPAGCIVPLTFDATTITAMRAGGALKVKAVADSGQDTPFTIPLKGFAAALDRTSLLLK